MCGRYTLRTPADVYEAVFKLALQHELRARYNIAPTQTAPVIREGKKSRESVLMKWGLIPSWAKDPTIGNRMINARLETAPEKPSFRAAFKRRRCLIPTDGFYEWKKEEKVGGVKQPYYIHLADDEPFAFAGLWESWDDPDGETVETYTILTAEPVGLMKKLHNRMPVIVPSKDYDAWLDRSLEDSQKAAKILDGRITKGLKVVAVSRFVNSPSNDTAKCIEPMAA